MHAEVCHAKAIELSKLVLRMTSRSGAGHPSSAVSLAHIITILMYGRMRFDPKDPWNASSDRLVLSEGHAVPMIYAAYADLGGVVGRDPRSARPLSIDDLDHLREFDSLLDGHPNPAEGFPFLDAATGSLGMGLSLAAGLALAARLDGIDKKIYCLIGDGESREGQIAEALDFIVDHDLSDICAIFNCNGEGQAGAVSPQQSRAVLDRKLSAFGWQTMTIDGHEPDQIAAALDRFEKTDRPFAIVAETVKGWGVTTLQGGNHHGKPVSADQLPDAMASLDAMKSKLVSDSSHARLVVPQCRVSPRPTIPGQALTLPPFAQVLRAAGLEAALEKKKLATRRAYGAALNALGAADPRIVALDGDVSNSTFADTFARQMPDRFFECKIAEQNMISVAVGLAAAGKIPFANSFAKFIGRAYDQVELAAISRANIKLVGSHAGLGPASDGPSQMALLDLAFFKALSEVDDGSGRPACTVFHPADAIAAYRLTELMANTAGMCYMRTHRPDVPFIYSFDAPFEVGGSNTLRRGTAITLVASGYMVCQASVACETLAAGGIDCTLIDAYSMPLETAPILKAAGGTENLILTIEDNYGGGFGAAIAEAAASAGTCRVEQLVVRTIPKSARKPIELMDRYGLSSSEICKWVRRSVRA